MEKQVEKTIKSMDKITIKSLLKDYKKHEFVFSYEYDGDNAKKYSTNESEMLGKVKQLFSTNLDEQKDKILTEEGLKNLTNLVYAETGGCIKIVKCKVTAFDNKGKQKSITYSNLAIGTKNVELPSQLKDDKEIDEDVIVKNGLRNISDNVKNLLKDDFPAIDFTSVFINKFVKEIKQVISSRNANKSVEELIINNGNDFNNEIARNLKKDYERFRDKEETKKIIEQAKQDQQKWQDIYLVEGKQFVGAKKLEEATNKDKLLEKALLDAIKDVKTSNSGKKENYFNRAAKNIDRYSKYKALLAEQAKEQYGNKEDKIVVIGNLTSSMEKYIEIKQANHAFVEDVPADYAPEDAITMILTGVKENNKTLSKEKEEHAKKALARRIGDERLTKNTIDDLIFEFSQNFELVFEDERLADQKIAKSKQLLSDPTKKQDNQVHMNEEELDVFLKQVKENKANAPKNELAPKYEVAVVEPTLSRNELRSLIVTDASVKVRAKDVLNNVKEKIAIALSAIGVPEKEIPTYQEAIFTRALHDQTTDKGRFQTAKANIQEQLDADAKKVQTDLECNILEQVNIVKEEVAKIRNACKKKFDSCVQSFVINSKGRIKNREDITNLIDVLYKDLSDGRNKLSLDDSLNSEIKKNYWNIEDLYLSELQLMAKSGEELTKEVLDNNLSRYIFDHANSNDDQYRQLYYSLFEDDLQKETEKVNAAFGTYMNTRVKEAIAGKVDLLQSGMIEDNLKADIEKHLVTDIILDMYHAKEMNSDVINQVAYDVKENSKKVKEFNEKFLARLDASTKKVVDKFNKEVEDRRQSAQARFDEILNSEEFGGDIEKVKEDLRARKEHYAVQGKKIGLRADEEQTLDNYAVNFAESYLKQIDQMKKADKDIAKVIYDKYQLKHTLTFDDFTRRYDTLNDLEIVNGLLRNDPKVVEKTLENYELGLQEQRYAEKQAKKNQKQAKKAEKEHKRNVEILKDYVTLDDYATQDKTYGEKIAMLERDDNDYVKNTMKALEEIKKNHPKEFEEYMEVYGSFPYDIAEKSKHEDYVIEKPQLDYKNIVDNMQNDSTHYDHLKNYAFLRRKDAKVYRGSLGKRIGAFFARHWYKAATIGFVGYMAASIALLIPATTSFVGVAVGAALTFVGGAVVSTLAFGKLPFLKAEILKNRAISYRSSRREVERSTRRADELLNGRHKGLIYGLKKIATFGLYDRNGGMVDRLDEANRILNRLQSMNMQDARLVKKAYKRIHKLLKVKGEGVLTSESGENRVQYTSKYAKKMAKRLGVDKNTEAIEVTNQDYVNMFLNNKAEDLHFKSGVKYTGSKFLGLFGRRSAGHAIQVLEMHDKDKYYEKMSNVWKITDPTTGRVRYEEVRKGQSAHLIANENAEQLTVRANYADDFNNLVDESKTMINSMQVILAKAERAYNNNMLHIENKLPKKELQALKERYQIEQKELRENRVLTDKEHARAFAKADYKGIKNERIADKKEYKRSLSDSYEQDKENGYDVNSNAATIDFAAIDFDTMPKAEKEKLAFNKVTIDDEADKKEVDRIKTMKSKKEQISAINKLIESREKKMNQVLASIASINSIIKGQSDLLAALEKQSGDKAIKKPTLTPEEKVKLETERKAKVDKVLKYFKGNKDLVKADSAIKYSITEEILKKAGIEELDLEQ